MDNITIQYISMNSASQSEMDEADALADISKVLTLQDYLDKAVRIKTVVEFHAFTRKLLYDFGYSIASCGLAYQSKQLNPRYHYLCSGNIEWIQYYRENLIQRDPFFDYCVKNVTPWVWMAKTDGYGLASVAPDFTEALNGFCVDSVVALPQRGPNCFAAGFRFGCQDNEKLKRSDIEATLPTLSLLSCYLYDALTNLIEPERPDSGVKLTSRETEILSWIAQGKDSWSISLILNISENTVHFHLKNIHKKMQVNSRQHAVVKAIKLNLIEI